MSDYDEDITEEVVTYKAPPEIGDVNASGWKVIKKLSNRKVLVSTRETAKVITESEFYEGM